MEEVAMVADLEDREMAVAEEVVGREGEAEVGAAEEDEAVAGEEATATIDRLGSFFRRLCSRET